jgi:hypothetical protein
MGRDNSLGSWAFIIGVAIALLGGAFGGYAASYIPWITLLLVVLGLIVGFLNITAKEVNDFLIAAIALASISGLANAGNLEAFNTAIPMFGTVLYSMVLNIAAFVSPAALVVALKAIYAMARTPK